MSNQLSFEFVKNIEIPFSPLIDEEKDLSNYSVYRPVHYLGSKLRLLDIIIDAVNQVDPSMGPICDLFSGSGTVSLAFSRLRNVVSVDIQEYSRVLCSSLLNPVLVQNSTVESFKDFLYSSEYSTKLFGAINPIIEYENDCLERASKGSLEPLCDFLENNSLVAFQLGGVKTASPVLKKVANEVLLRLDNIGLSNSNRTLVSRYFGGSYFSFFQSVQLDIILEAINQVSFEQRDVFLAALLSTASEIVNTVGKQFAQPIRPRRSNGEPKHNLYSLASRDRYNNAFDVYQNWLTRYLSTPLTNLSHRTLRQDYSDALSELRNEVSVIYADPPYTRDHYSRFYHVLETLCLRDNPEVSKVRIGNEDLISRGLYRQDRHQSPFCIKSQAPAAFSDLFEKASQLKVPLILSYSPFVSTSNARPRLMTIQQIESLANKYYKKVTILSAGKISHSKLNSADKNTDITYDAELIFKCEL